MDRRHILKTGAALGSIAALGGCASTALTGAYNPVLQPVRAAPDRIFDITICLRPFRAAGPRLDTETIRDTLVVHNYGHGGSGWSLSWGSSTIAVGKAMTNSPRDVAVIGCGALGLTSAILAQRAGAKVTIYAREELPQTRSSRATGSWTPDSRIALTGSVGPEFPAQWEQMARTSFKTYRSYLGLPGDPVEWRDHYNVSDVDMDDPKSHTDPPDNLGFASYHHRIDDLFPQSALLPKGATQFDAPFVYRGESLIFNIADYGHTLMSDFRLAGGTIRHREFHAPSEYASLKEKVVINCTGYGARDLWKDNSITPVRGQIAWLIPQPEVNYGVFYNGVNILARRDGIVVQALAGGDIVGYGDDNETPDRAQAEKAVATAAELYRRFRAPSA
jgi:glycine/D-amino acid oxidase-like deaminating enzyme